MEKVFKIDGQWVFCEDGYPVEESNNTQIFDSFQPIAISDSIHAQMYVLGHNGKYGIYTLDNCYWQGGPGKYYNPTKEAFPFDEILLSRREEGICHAEFCIWDKWGIEKIVVYVNDDKVEDFQNIYTSTKRKTVVPCKYGTLKEAQPQIPTWTDFRERSDNFVWDELPDGLK